MLVVSAASVARAVSAVTESWRLKPDTWHLTPDYPPSVIISIFLRSPGWYSLPDWICVNLCSE